jgi:hypothetical protein
MVDFGKFIVAPEEMSEVFDQKVPRDILTWNGQGGRMTSYHFNGIYLEEFGYNVNIRVNFWPGKALYTITIAKTLPDEPEEKYLRVETYQEFLYEYLKVLDRLLKIERNQQGSYVFPWGEVYVSFDERTPYSEIVIRYGETV